MKISLLISLILGSLTLQTAFASDRDLNHRSITCESSDTSQMTPEGKNRVLFGLAVAFEKEKLYEWKAGAVSWPKDNVSYDSFGFFPEASFPIFNDYEVFDLPKQAATVRIVGSNSVDNLVFNVRSNAMNVDIHVMSLFNVVAQRTYIGWTFSAFVGKPGEVPDYSNGETNAKNAICTMFTVW